ncbi:MAG: MurR/RpiR family transcriptional regulator [Spirochaetales bacterium]|nr:MurR/RpiR family transcriptional regulator [Spirochaetales bacterium]
MVARTSDSGCLDAIRTALGTSSAKERRVAEYILAHPGDAVNPSIEELAEHIGVSESTLFRFVRKLGFGGYQQFRIALATEVLAPRDTWYEAPEAAFDEQSAVTTVFKTSIAALEATLASLDQAALDTVARTAVEAPCILLFGLGGSNTVAQDALHKFVRTGVPCQAPSDFHLQLMVASQAKPGSLAILFSHTGANVDALSILETVRRDRVTVVVVTSHARSPLARKADVVLVSRTPSVPYVSEAWSARIAQLAIMDSLYVLIMERLGDAGNRHLQDMRNAIAGRRL